jgi:uncharacterized protein YkwD
MIKQAILVFLILLTGCSAPSDENYGGVPNELVLLKLHNEARFAQRYGDLQIDPFLDDAAQKHADWMAEHHNMSHTGAGRSDVGDRISKEYHWTMAGENIAYGQKSVEEVHKVWMNSRGHRANILNKGFMDIGIGITVADNGQIYWCVVFGRPSNN